MERVNVLLVAIAIFCSFTIGCANDLNTELELSQDSPRGTIAGIQGDWEIVMPDENLAQSSEDVMDCSSETAGLLYINRWGEAMMGLIELKTCDGHVERETFSGRVLVEEDGHGGFQLLRGPEGLSENGDCLLMEEDWLHCTIVSPFDGQLMSHDWIRVD